ncbi:splicing factor YJU2-like [Littorina saxatilis]|uniref:Splicing factor YJU2 n=1 Tax=Littorina saxatilis TaxID=31220 RepID=A0AAN9BJF1_9CAEN
MSERKVLNKYYPPDFDPSKIPKLRESKNKTFSIRIMAPFNMRCNVCGEYIYKGKKFNSRKENVEDEDFLGLRIFRFYIRCPKCVAEIAFKTDLKNTDYTLEAGATRLFEAEKLAQQMAERERLEKEAEELNPMKVLENRTKASHREMAQIDELEELREINARHAKVDTNVLLERQTLYEEHLLRLQEEEEDKIVQSIFGTEEGLAVKRLADSDSDDETEGRKPKVKKPALGQGQAPTDLLTDATPEAPSTKQEAKKTPSWQKSVGTLSSKGGLAGLVKRKPAAKQKTNKPSHSSDAAASKPLPSNNGVTPTASTETQRLVASSLSQQAKTQSAVSSSAVNGPTKTVVTAGSATQSSSNKGGNSASLSGGSALGLLGGYSGSESDSDSS